MKTVTVNFLSLLTKKYNNKCWTFENEEFIIHQNVEGTRIIGILDSDITVSGVMSSSKFFVQGAKNFCL